MRKFEILFFLIFLSSCIGKEAKSNSEINIELSNKHSDQISNLKVIFIHEDFKKLGNFYKLTDTLFLNRNIEVNSKYLFAYNFYNSPQLYFSENEIYIQFLYQLSKVQKKKTVSLMKVFKTKVYLLELNEN